MVPRPVATVRPSWRTRPGTPVLPETGEEVVPEPCRTMRGTTGNGREQDHGLLPSRASWRACSSAEPHEQGVVRRSGGLEELHEAVVPVAFPCERSGLVPYEGIHTGPGQVGRGHAADEEVMGEGAERSCRKPDPFRAQVPRWSAAPVPRTAATVLRGASDRAVGSAASGWSRCTGLPRRTPAAPWWTSRCGGGGAGQKRVAHGVGQV